MVYTGASEIVVDAVDTTAASVADPEPAEAPHRVCQPHSSVGGSVPDDAHMAVARFPQHGLDASFPAEPDSPGRARRVVVAALEQWGQSEALIGDVALTLSELASNAVRHARSSFSIVVRVQDSTLRIAVRDHAPLIRSLPDGGLIPHPMHGLGLVAALSRSWGIERTHDGKVVWAQLSYEAPADPPPTFGA